MKIDIIAVNEATTKDVIANPPSTTCSVCKKTYPDVLYEKEAEPPVCTLCLSTLPTSLIKACTDPFSYALRLRDGTTIRFESASLNGKFAHITCGYYGSNIDNSLPWPCPRGIDVRIADIVWCVDAPEGS